MSKSKDINTVTLAKKENNLRREINRQNNSEINRKKPIIELKNISKSFRVGKDIIPVLKDINVKIYPQEFIIILGPSGSGKSTLLNIILGLEIPTSGRITINGEDLTKKNPNKMAKFRYHTFGMVFQRADWVRSLNVIQNVVLPLAIANVPGKKRMEKAWQQLKEIGIDDHAQYIPTELSGGQQQKVCLARALVTDPPILIADEPTGNLDTESAERVMQTFKNLNDKLKKTLLMVTHNIDYVSYASRTIYIRDGKVLEGIESYIKK